MTSIFENDAELETTLLSLRPTPDPAFAAELDARAAAGFAAAGGDLRSRLSALGERLRATPPRRILAPAGALALTAIVISTAVIATSGSDDGAADDPVALSTSARPAQEKAAGAEPGFQGGTNRAGSTQYDGSVPVSPSTSVGAAAGSGNSSAMQAETALPPAADTGPYAAGRDDRAIERSASIVLGTDPEGLRDAAAGVFDAVHAADGVVLRSAIDGGPDGGAASFELLIPSARLSDTLASISSVAEVRSRREATDDITAPTVSVSERLQDANATVRGLLDQLAAADTDAERVAAEAELRAARARAAGLRSSLSGLERRANLSRVSVRIETDGKGSGSDSGGAWGIGDGFDTAGRVLTTIAGVTLIGLAALAPFALIALLVWLARRAWVSRSRRNALSRP